LSSLRKISLSAGSEASRASQRIEASAEYADFVVSSVERLSDINGANLSINLC